MYRFTISLLDVNATVLVNLTNFVITCYHERYNLSNGAKTWPKKEVEGKLSVHY